MIFFREKFLHLREKQGLTQKQIAHACGVAESSVCGWENGTNVPRAARIPKLAAILHCAESDIAQYGPLENALDSINRDDAQINAILFGADVARDIRAIQLATHRRKEYPEDSAEESIVIYDHLNQMFHRLANVLNVSSLPENNVDDFRFGLLRALIKSDMSPEDKNTALKIVENFGTEC